MTVEAWVREVEIRITREPGERWGRAFCGRDQYRSFHL